MIKRRLFLEKLTLLSVLIINPFIADAYAKSTDPAQLYREEIQQAETNASQTLMDQLDTSSSDVNNPQLHSATPSPQEPLPPSDSEKAFSVPETQKNTQPNTKTSPTTGTPNPWLKPNPWASQAKVNPWANAPIPSSEPPSSARNTPFSPPGPPNIFAPPPSAQANTSASAGTNPT